MIEGTGNLVDGYVDDIFDATTGAVNPTKFDEVFKVAQDGNLMPDQLDDLIAKLELKGDASLVSKIDELKALKNTAEFDVDSWNTFRTSLKGQGLSQAEMGDLWEVYKKENGIIYNAATGSSSKKLRESLVAAGKQVPDYDNAAHHIVAGTSQNAVEARKVLENCGIDINDAANGVFLPTVKDVTDAAYHPSLHTDAYYRKVSEMLKGVTQKEDALDILADIADQLTNGTFMN